MSLYEENIVVNRDVDLNNVFGDYDANLKILKDNFDVNILSRNNEIRIIGEKKRVKLVNMIIMDVIKFVSSNNYIDEQNLLYIIDLNKKKGNIDYNNITKESIIVTASGKTIKPKTLGQKRYVEKIRKNDITICIGPAGTGKTYLAVAAAVNAFRKKEVNRIILTRPAVEAGEKLGFLPGDLQDKVDPYLRPLYDALFDIMGPENYLKNLEKGSIEIAPLAYMRGRTLDSSFIILDEAQNSSYEQMKMFLTRFGYGSKVVITGDITQIDLPNKKQSGLKITSNILKDINGIDCIFLEKEDVVRHKLIQNIINAYEKFEIKEKVI